MTRQLTVTLSEKQEYFLKMFAEKHYDYAPDNCHTVNAFHVVERKRYEYIPYSDDSVDWYGSYPLVFTADDEYDNWYEDEVELIQDYFNNSYSEEFKFPIIPFKEAHFERLTGVDGEETYISNRTDYFAAYGIELLMEAWKKEYWEPQAYFFIRDEAVRYQQYQKHNLGISRVYTHSSGYSNYGDFDYFRNLLLHMGTELNREDVE